MTRAVEASIFDNLSRVELLHLVRLNGLFFCAGDIARAKWEAASDAVDAAFKRYRDNIAERDRVAAEMMSPQAKKGRKAQKLALHLRSLQLDSDRLWAAYERAERAQKRAYAEWQRLWAPDEQDGSAQ